MMNSRMKGILFFFVTICYVTIPMIQFHAGDSRAIPREGAALRHSSSMGFLLHAQEKGKTAPKTLVPEKETRDPKPVQEQDERGMLIKVMAVVLAVWLGIALFLVRINLKIVKLEKEINDL